MSAILAGRRRAYCFKRIGWHNLALALSLFGDVLSLQITFPNRLTVRFELLRSNELIAWDQWALLRDACLETWKDEEFIHFLHWAKRWQERTGVDAIVVPMAILGALPPGFIKAQWEGTRTAFNALNDCLKGVSESFTGALRGGRELARAYLKGDLRRCRNGPPGYLAPQLPGVVYWVAD